MKVIVEDIKAHVKKTEVTVEKIETHVKSTNLVVQDLQAELGAQKAWRQNGEAFNAAEKRNAILHWMYNQDFDTKHLEISSKRQKNTGKWILETPEFRDWLEKKRASRLLWGYGIPGAGKTFLSSVVIDYFQAQVPVSKHGIAYLYFDYKDQDGQMPIYVIASLTKQLASQAPSLVLEIEDLYDRTPKNPTLDELYTALVATTTSFDRVFLVLDALDECDQKKQRNHLLPLLQRLLAINSDISLFATSRHYPEDIQDSFYKATKIKISARAEDIATYIEGEIEASPRARRLVQQSGCKEKIISGLTECAQGMFLLVHFHIQHLCQQTTGRQILNELEKLKDSHRGDRSLDPTYDRAIESLYRRPKSSTELALKILSWLVKAQRKLTVEELQVAVSIRSGQYELDELDLPDRATILDVCAGLVTIDDTNDGSTISLAHYTVQEYLLRNSLILEDAEYQIAMACIVFLSFDIFTDGACISADSMSHRLISQPFLGYAATYLLFHIKACDEALSTDITLNFLRKRNTISSYLQATVVMRYGCDAFDSYPRQWLQLHAASYLGHYTAMKILLAGGANPLATSSDMSIPLHLAVPHGDHTLIQLLLGNGAGVSYRDSNGQTGLYVAVLNGCETVVKLLLDHGANASAPDRDGTEPLWQAVFRVHENIVRLLLDNGANVSTTGYGKTPLYAAAINGYETIAKLLLENGANISTPDTHGATPLWQAGSSGHERIVQLLIDNGANVSTPDFHGTSPLYATALGSHRAIVKLLLENGADVSSPGDGRTALQQAVYEGHDAIVKILLDSGSNTSNPDLNGTTPLWQAVSREHESIVHLLLENGVDSSIPCHGKTPLLEAVSRGNQNIFQMLLTHGANISTPDIYGTTPLLEAVSRGHEYIAQLLIDNGVDVSTPDTYGTTPLLEAVSRGHEYIAQLLIQCGATPSPHHENESL